MLCSHRLDEIRLLVDHVLALEEGRVTYDGSGCGAARPLRARGRSTSGPTASEAAPWLLARGFRRTPAGALAPHAPARGEAEAPAGDLARARRRAQQPLGARPRGTRARPGRRRTRRPAAWLRRPRAPRSVRLALAALGLAALRRRPMARSRSSTTASHAPTAACSISDPSFAAQLQTQDGEMLDFDDPGCLLRWLATHAPTVRALWFHHVRDDRWLDAASRASSRCSAQPMGYGLGAVAAGTPQALARRSRRAARRARRPAPRAGHELRRARRRRAPRSGRGAALALAGAAPRALCAARRRVRARRAARVERARLHRRRARAVFAVARARAVPAAARAARDRAGREPRARRRLARALPVAPDRARRVSRGRRRRSLRRARAAARGGDARASRSEPPGSTARRSHGSSSAARSASAWRCSPPTWASGSRSPCWCAIRRGR